MNATGKKGVRIAVIHIPKVLSSPRLLLLAALCAAAGTLHVSSSVPEAALSSKAASAVAASLPAMHLSGQPLDDQHATDALDIFLEALDPEHMYFLATDVSGFRKEAATLDDELRAGHVTLAKKMYGVYLDRVSNRVDYVDTLLAKGFDVEAAESFSWKRRKASPPADEAEWNELWRKRIKNEYVARMVAKEVGEEDAVRNLVKTSEDEETATDAEQSKLSPEEGIRKSYRRFLSVLRDTEESWVEERYLTSFAQAYDPHSDYMSPGNLEDFEIGMRLSLVGIGALLSSEDGAAKVERVVPGGPADRDGRLKAGDKIVAVAQGDEETVDILHWPLSKIVRMIRGEKDTRVVLTVIPASDASGSTRRKIDIVRDEVKLEERAAKGETHTVKGPDGSEHKFGIVRLPEFYAEMRSSKSNGDELRSCTRDVRRILEDLKTQGVAGIVLDLRNNGGGSLSEAIDMTGLFISRGPVVQVKDQSSMHSLGDRDAEVVYDGPLVVLVNRLSASASEIVAGALQDYGRAVIVGDSKTHGKGTVQTLANLGVPQSELGSLKITTASFYRIAGGSTQQRGVEPDIVIPSVLDAMEIGEEFLPHAMPWTTVNPVRYREVGHLGPLVPGLRDRSAKRRSADPRFQAYEELVSRLAERQKAESISLKLSERLALARQEKELQKQLDAIDVHGPKEDDTSKDVVLLESLNILGDWAAEADGSEALTRSETGGAITEPAKPPL
jgi:carboxyl-terminal processing protease